MDDDEKQRTYPMREAVDAAIREHYGAIWGEEGKIVAGWTLIVGELDLEDEDSATIAIFTAPRQPGLLSDGIGAAFSAQLRVNELVQAIQQADDDD
jgi:hypothetical protein